MTAENKNIWASPQEVTKVDLAFGGDTQKLLPPMAEIPAEFQRISNPWVKLVSRWFFEGLAVDTKFTPKPSVDADKALRHLSAIMRSRVPKHEHKEAGVAYLMSLWFESAK